jgi:ppGpp synthetase/RelA/SpoT-type nucleotidyltranferase
MPLTDRLIRDAKERYWREIDRYVKLAEYVHTRCKSIVKDDAIRATTQARAKDPERFEEKLRRYQKNPQKCDSLDSVDAIMSRVGDLAGVRVATYVEKDRDRVVKAIETNFSGPDGSRSVLVEKKDGHALSSFYRATHCQVTIKESELVGTYANLRDLTCEIQVCSLLAHVFNEIEHDLGYKPLAGEISEAETRFLGILGSQTQAGDTVIEGLLSVVAARRQAAGAPFNDQYDFVARIRDRFTDVASFAQHAGQLFEELKSLNLDSPTAMERAGLLANDHDRRSRELVREFQAFLRRRQDDFEVDDDTSDRLLMLLLDKRADDVIQNHRVGRGYGRAPRIYSVAMRFRDMRSEPSAGSEP